MLINRIECIITGIIIGITLGYTWHYQAIKNYKKVCTWQDIPAQTIVLNDKIPAKLINP